MCINMKKFITIILLVFVINLSLAHSKGVYQNYDEIEDIKNEKTTKIENISIERLHSSDYLKVGDICKSIGWK